MTFMASSTKTLERKLDKLADDLALLRIEVRAKARTKLGEAESAKASWRRLTRKVSRRWRSGTAVEEIAAQRTKTA